jgi:hypothetical protein
MLEFALSAPLFFLLLCGVIEFGVLMFDTATTRFAASEAAKVEAQVGNQATLCGSFTGCTDIYGNSAAQAATACDADCQAIIAVHKTALGGLKLEQVNYIEIQQIQASGGNFSPYSPVRCQRYNFDGSLYTKSPLGGCSNYPATGRGVVTGLMDYVQVNINFTYNWMTALLRSAAPIPTLDTKFVVRLEPQQFAAPPAPVTPTPGPTPVSTPPPGGTGCGDNC